MKRHTSRNLHRDEKPKPSRNEDSDAILRARTEEERQRRRREWVIEQEKMDRHNKLKRKMAMEYEIRRARNMGLPLPEGRCNRSHRSRSESPPSRHRRTSEHNAPKVTLPLKKFETSSDTTPLFKGPEGIKISSTELRKIKVDIHRNIPGRPGTHALKRDIPNKEDVVLKRRAVQTRFVHSPCVLVLGMCACPNKWIFEMPYLLKADQPEDVLNLDIQQLKRHDERLNIRLQHWKKRNQKLKS